MNILRNTTLRTMLLLVLVFAAVPSVVGLEAGEQDRSATPAVLGTFSGDDAYDPAAGATPQLAVAARPTISRSAAISPSTFSGDDAYDVAAGSSPELSVAGATLGYDARQGLACELADDEIVAREAWSVAGGFSGDDAYDRAAGGTPELSLLPFVENVAQLESCEPIVAGF